MLLAIHHELTKTIILLNYRHSPSISIGVAICSGENKNPQKVIDTSYRAMLNASEITGNSCIFHTGNQVSTKINKILESDLERSLQQGEFHLLYQPIIESSSGEIKGAEALLRWDNPRFGKMLPEFFIPIAEQTGLIVPIGKWVFEQACQTLSSWRAANLVADDFFLTVNVSYKQLELNGFSVMMNEIIDKYELTADKLQLEFTECALMENIQQGLKDLAKLKQNGFAIAIDDFGTGYASLNYINNLPIDTIKIDRSYIYNYNQAAIKTAIKSILRMAHSLNLHVVAEGVDSKQQCHWLRQQGCEQMQGYYFSQPVSGDILLGILKEKVDG